MRRIGWYVVVFCAFVCMAAVGGEREDAAAAGALEWLSALDKGQYELTWRAASPLFKQQVKLEKWVETSSGVRQPLGQVKSRTLKRAAYERKLPNAPQGEYVVILFDTSFENKASAIETITMRLLGERWGVIGYFIK